MQERATPVKVFDDLIRQTVKWVEVNRPLDADRDGATQWVLSAAFSMVVVAGAACASVGALGDLPGPRARGVSPGAHERHRERRERLTARAWVNRGRRVNRLRRRAGRHGLRRELSVGGDEGLSPVGERARARAPNGSRRHRECGAPSGRFLR